MSMRPIRIKHVNAFTSEPFSGNPAGVVLDARELSETKLQAIAREMNLSETAFVLPASNRKADLQIRWFTPAMEVPLCGHATIAAFHALAEENMWGMRQPGKYSFQLQTRSGILSIQVDKQFSGNIVEFQLPIPQLRVKRSLTRSMRDALGLRLRDLDDRLPIVSQSYLYVPVRRLSRLNELKPDFQALKQACRSARYLGVCVFSLDTLEKSSALHSRFFAPAAGIDEDPVTGSANGPLGAYLYRFLVSRDILVPWFLLPDGRLEFIGEQGDLLDRKGRVKIRVRTQDDKIDHLSIAGEAVTMLNSTLMC